MLSMLTFKGIVLTWKTQDNYFREWVEHVDEKQLYQLFEDHGLFYDEMASMNLRSPSRQLVLVFRKKKI